MLERGFSVQVLHLICSVLFAKYIMPDVNVLNNSVMPVER